jgi:hypothetical protein
MSRGVGRKRRKNDPGPRWQRILGHENRALNEIYLHSEKELIH